MKGAGLARSIGVSNFQRDHLEAVLEVCTVVPAINQLEFHPYLQRDADFIPWMGEKGVEVSSFKTLAPITVGAGGFLDPVLQTIADNHGVATSTVLLSWAIGRNVVPITTTSKGERMDGYLAAVTTKLSTEEEEEITRVGLQHHFRWWGRRFFSPDDRS